MDSFPRRFVHRTPRTTPLFSSKAGLKPLTDTASPSIMQHLVLRIGISPGIEKQCSDGDCIGVADRVVKGSLPTLSQHAGTQYRQWPGS